MPNHVSSLLVALGVALCAACAAPTSKVDHVPRPALAQAPVPTAYPLSAQQKMQAMYHWDVLAEDVARRVQEFLDRRVVERQLPVYVAPSGVTPFAKSFHALLITRLVNKNITVSKSFENALVLSFDIEMVRHAERITRTGKGVYKALAPDVYVQRHDLTDPDPENFWAREAMLRAAEHNVDAGAYTYALPRVEVMITSTLLSGESFLMRDSSIYYINDADWWHYRPPHAAPQGSGLVNFQLVDR